MNFSSLFLFFSFSCLPPSLSPAPAFQLIDTDYTIGEPVRIGTSMTQFSQKQAILRLFGVNDAGNSILAYVHNFMSYFYVPAWPGCTTEQINMFGQSLNVRKQRSSKRKGGERSVKKGV